jgi:hypothetical protein
VIHISTRGLILYLVCMALILAAAALLHIGSWVVAGVTLLSIAMAVVISHWEKRRVD